MNNSIFDVSKENRNNYMYCNVKIFIFINLGRKILLSEFKNKNN